MIVNITQQLLDELTAQAKTSPHLRQYYDLRNSKEDKSQRMLNALEPGTVIPIHRHTSSSETLIILRGRLTEVFFNEKGDITETIELSPVGPIYALNIPAGQFHTLQSLETGTVVVECKEGPYKPLADDDILRQ